MSCRKLGSESNGPKAGAVQTARICDGAVMALTGNRQAGGLGVGPKTGSFRETRTSERPHKCSGLALCARLVRER